MRSATVAFACLLLLAALAGAGEPAPAPAGPVAAPLRYLRERALDLLDAVELNVGAGRGAKLSVQYGLQFFGAGSVRSHRVGTIDRRVGRWRELDTELGLLPLSLLAWPVHYAAKAAGRRQLAADAAFVAKDASDGFEHLDRKELNGDPVFLLKDTVTGPVHTRWGDSFPIGFEVHALVGVRARVRPLQLADFLVGFVGVELDPWLATNPAR